MTLVTSLLLALGVTLSGHFLVSSLAYERRMHMQAQVLAHTADSPYQQHMYLVSLICQWLHDHLGLTLLHTFTLMFGLGYLLLFLGVWQWLRQLYRQPGAILIGLFALAAYAGMLMPYAFDHPADVFGAAFISLTLAAAMRGSTWGILASSLVAGFFWSKQVLLAPILLVHETTDGRWRRGLAIGAILFVVAAVGPVYYRWLLGYHPVVAGGILTPLEWIRSMPKSVLYHLGFALPPLLSLFFLKRRLHPIVRTGSLLYPEMIVAYAAVGLFIYELRSFWPVVPVFVALLAAWGESGEEDGGMANGSESVEAGEGLE
jgi:hypothetical protein